MAKRKQVQYDNKRLLEMELSPHITTIKINDEKAFFTDLTDVHIGHKGVDYEALDAFVEVVKATPNLYVFIGGDASNHANRGSKSSPWEEDMSPREQIKGKYDVYGNLVNRGLVQIFEPIQDRILGIIDGNHNTTRLKEFNDMSAAEYYSDLTGVPYYGALAMVEFVIGNGKNSYLHFLHHSGATGKRKNVNALQDRVFNWEADVHWGEHTHKSHFARDTVVYYDRKNKKPLVRDRLYINGSSYLSWSGYAKDKLYAPNETGCKIVEMSGKRGEWDMRVYERVRDFVELQVKPSLSSKF